MSNQALKYELEFLGEPRYFLYDRVNNQLRKPIVQALLARTHIIVCYVLLSRRVVTRESLQTLLWPDSPEARGRNNVAIAINQIKNSDLHKLFEWDDAGIWPIAELNTLAVIDVWQLNHAATTMLSRIPTDELQTIIDGYSAGFLTGLKMRGIRKLEALREWIESNRRNFDEQLNRVLHEYIKRLVQAEQFSEAIPYALRLLENDPYHEEYYQILMRLYIETAQIPDVRSTYQRCVEMLKTEFGLVPQAETDRLFERTHDARPSFAWTIVTRKVFQAPKQTDVFVGRTEILTQIAADLQHEQGKAISALVGLGGVGKTTVAIHLAHQLRDYFKDGVLWGSLAANDLNGVIENWGRALGLPLDQIATIENKMTALRSGLEGKRVLLVLDNVADAANVRDILPADGSARVLITTRDHDIAYTLGSKIIDLPVLSAEASLSLLTKILGEERLAQEGETAAADTVCNLLEYLPLALEIIARRMQSRPNYSFTRLYKALLDVHSKLDPLTMGNLAVRISFDFSWNQLTDKLKRVFMAMGVFQGLTVSAEALAYVLDTDKYSADDDMFKLSALSLCWALPEDYRQHALLVDYAGEQLAVVANYDNSYEKRLAQYFVEHAKTHKTNIPMVDSSFGHYQMGLDAAFNTKQFALTVSYTDVLESHWLRAARHKEANLAFEKVLQVVQRYESDEQITQILIHQSKHLIEMGDYKLAERQLLECVRICLDNDYLQLNKAGASIVLARVYQERGDYIQTLAYLSQAESIYKEKHQDAEMNEVSIRKARVFYEQRKLGEAQMLLRDIVARDNEFSLQRMIALRLMALIYESQPETALGFIEQAIDVGNRINAVGELASSRLTLGYIKLNLQDWHAANLILHEAREQFIYTGDKKSVATADYYFARSAYLQAKYSEAHIRLNHALDLYKKLNASRAIFECLMLRGVIFRAEQQKQLAKDVWRDAIVIAKRLGLEQDVTTLEDGIARLGLD